MFSAVLEAQRQSRDLTVYSRIVGSMVKIACAPGQPGKESQSYLRESRVFGRQRHVLGMLLRGPLIGGSTLSNRDLSDKRIRPRILSQYRTRPQVRVFRLRTIQKYSKDFNIVTVRRNGLTLEEQALAIDIITEEDPIGRWGCRTVQDKLALQGIHINRDGIMCYRRAQNEDATDARNPHVKKAHPHGLWSLGPNEEWCVDGHEKILKSMGIAVWGIADKCARMELELWAMPNARVQELPPALYLRLVKKQGGMALSTTMDKGTEVGKLISLVKSMRALYADIPEDILPSFKAVKSTSNITRERSWRPLWEKELANVAHEYQLGKIASGFRQGDPTHVVISCWLWGQIVQKRLDQIVEENQNHKIRKQKKTLLPSSAQRIDIYKYPEDHKLINCLIEVPEKDIDQLLLEYDRPDLLQFGTDEELAFCEEVYAVIGSPILLAKFGWEIFRNMVNYCIENTNWEAEEEEV